MKESTGSVSALYIVIFFIIIIFGFIISTLSYYKSYKINNSLTAAIEDYGGFNEKSNEEIEKRLDSYGYNRNTNVNCKQYDNAQLIDVNGKIVSNSSNLGYKGYCVYLVDDSGDGSYTYYSYKVATYLTLDFGIADVRIPYQITSNTFTMYSCYGANCD